MRGLGFIAVSGDKHQHPSLLPARSSMQPTGFLLQFQPTAAATLPSHHQIASSQPPLESATTQGRVLFHRGVLTTQGHIKPVSDRGWPVATCLLALGPMLFALLHISFVNKTGPVFKEADPPDFWFPNL